MKSHRRFSGVSVVLCLVTTTSQVLANPVGESLRAGRARFDRSAPGSLSIHQQTDKLIINWREFSIAAGETTRFIQPSATSIALNRVVTANPSRLFGNLEANGKVYLINPNGILVGRGGAVNTRGFVASTLDVSDASFLSSAKLRLSGDSEASVVNEGSIQAIGGDVFLVGRTVENSGAIRGGAVGLGAGSEVMIVPTGRERLSVIAGNPNGGQLGKGVNNEGTIDAVSAELKAAGGNIYALAINNGGIIRATGVRRESGRVFLSSGGGDIENSGVIAANNANGGGGFVRLAGGHNDSTPSTVINSGIIEARGDSVGTEGGEVRMTGDYVGLFGASVIDVSGHSGGGTALIGGDYQGANARIQNAQRTFVGPDARINADALVQGDGGKAIVWSDEITRFAGSISARGGSAGGNGGFAEVSGKTFLQFNGRADLTAANGLAGTILLDPQDATVQDTGADDAFLADSTLAFAEPDTTTDVTISDDVIEALTGNVIIQAHRNLFINEALTLANQTAGETVEFQAGGDLDINATVVTGGATLSFTASDAGGANSATASLTVDAAVGDANTGAISFINDGSGGITVNAAVTTGNVTAADAAGAQTVTSGGITLNSGGPVTISVSGSLTTGSAQLTGADGGDDAVTSGGILITSTGDAVLFDGNLATGNATVGDENGDDTATTGNITISAGTGISGSGQAATGNALMNPAGTGVGQNAANSGDISLTAGTGGVSGGIGLSAASALSIGTATGDNTGGDPGANDEANAGSITLTSFGEINNGTASTALSLGPVGPASGATINNPGQLAITTTDAGGNIFVTSASDLSVGAVSTGAGAQTVSLSTSGGAALTIQDAAESLQGDAVTLNAGAGTLTIDDDDYNVGAGSLTLIGSEINLTGNNDGIQGTGALVIQPNTAGGNIELAGADDGSTLDLLLSDLAKLADGFSSITIGRASDGTGTLTVSAASAFNDDLTLVAGSLVFDAAVTSAGNAVTLTARTGDITDGNAALANLVAASLSASAQTGIDLDTTITTLTLAEVLGAGAIDISDTAGGLAVTTATTANGDITLSADGGNLDVTSATAVGTGRDVNLTTTTSGDVRVGNVIAANDTVTINAADAIDELGVADPDADITAATVSLTAGTGIGGAGTLELDATTLSLADVTGTGGIDLIDISGGLAVTAATTSSGDITLNAVGGNLAVATATAGGGSSDINLSTTTSGDVQVGNVTALNDLVTINSAGAIEELGTDAAADITAGTISLTAATGIGAAATLEINAATLSLASVTGIGAIDLSDTAAGLIVTDANTFDGDITLNATGGDLTVTTVTANGTGADVQLTTTTSGDVNVGAVTAAGDSVTITSAGAITDGNGGLVNVVADDLSATAQTGIDLDTTLTTLILASVLGTGNINIADTDGLIVTSATTATGGDITLGATGADLDVTTASAGGTGDIQLTTTTSGNVNVGAVTAGDDVTITSAGAITDGNAGALNVTADGLTATATSVGTAGDTIETSVNSLDLNTSTAGGDQFITEADGLTGLNLNAGLGDVALTLTLGALADTDGATDITADQATITLSEAAVRNFGATGNRIATSVNDLTVNTSAGGGDQFITEANGLTALNLNAGVGVGAGDVNLTLTLGAVADIDGLTDITAGDEAVVILSEGAVRDFGSAANEIQTSVLRLSVDTSAGDGSQFIREVNGLTALNLNADGGNVNLTLAAGSALDTDANTDIDAFNITVGAIGGPGSSIGAALNPIEIDASGTTVTLTALGGTGSGVHVEMALPGNVTFTDSQPYTAAAVQTLFTHGAATFQSFYSSDLTVRANGNINSTIAAGNFLRAPGVLTLNAVGAGSSIGGGIANPFAIDVGTLNASAGAGLAFSEANNVTLGNVLGNVSGGSSAFFIEAANTLTFNGGTTIDAGLAGTAILVANGIPGVIVAGTPAMNSRFLLYALNAELTDPLVIINTLGVPAIGALVADAIDSPRNFNPLTPDPFGDLLDYFIFSLEANPPTDPSLFIDIPVEVFQPVSIVFGSYDPTKFGEVGDLWMSSSELYEIERKAGKARKALPPQVNRSKYTPQGNQAGQ